jgi:acetyl-CoA carboxylase biotin carboxylase subunit
VNTRIQVEHPITEQVIDYDLIREQIMVAAGIPFLVKNLPQLHAIECRIMQKIRTMISVHQEKSQHCTCQVDMEFVYTHVYSIYIPPNYDSMIAKLITTAQTREEAISKMRRALDEFVLKE